MKEQENRVYIIKEETKELLDAAFPGRFSKESAGKSVPLKLWVIATIILAVLYWFEAPERLIDGAQLIFVTLALKDIFDLMTESPKYLLMDTNPKAKFHWTTSDDGKHHVCVGVTAKGKAPISDMATLRQAEESKDSE